MWISFSDDDIPKTRKSLLGLSSRAPVETVILDDDTDIYTIRRGNEIRFQRSSSSRPPHISAKYTSTPEDKPFVNLTNDDDDDVYVVKEHRKGAMKASRADKSKWNSSLDQFSIPYFKPFTGSSYLKSMQQNGDCAGAKAKENIRPR